MFPVEKFYRDIVGLLHEANHLEKRASADPSDQRLWDKTQHDVYVFKIIKTAGLNPEIINALKSKLAPAGKAFGKGIAYGLVPAVGTVGAGALAVPYIANRIAKTKEETTKRIIEDARNKALQTALGIGAIGGGLMGVHHLLTKRDQSPMTQPSMDASMGLMPSYSDYGYKMSAAHTAPALIEKLATTGYLDVMLEQLEKTAEHQTEALYCRALNAEHGTHLLRQILA